MTLVHENFDTQIMMVYNGKFGGGRINLSPFSVLNDGYIEAAYYKERFTFLEAITLFEKCKAGGVQAYPVSYTHLTLPTKRIV